MLVCQIWSVNCDKKTSGGSGEWARKSKQNSIGCVRTIFVRDCVGEGTEFVVTKLQAN